MMRTIFFAAVVALGLGQAAPARAQTADSSVVARVNGEAITNTDMAMFHESLPAEYRQVPLETLYGQLLEGLIERKLLVMAARDAGLSDDETVKQRLAFAKDDILQEAYVGRLLNAEISDQRLRTAYQALVASHAGNEEVHARHILLDSEEDARAVIAELAAGADFAEMAQQHSTGPSGPNGGDLGYFPHGQMVPAFADAAFALETGAITTDPVQTQFGWHVIKLEDRRPTAPPSFEAVEAELHNGEVQTILIDLMERLRAGAAITRFDATGNEIAAPPAAGGDAE